MRDSVPSASYSSVCNVLRQWNIPLIPTLQCLPLSTELLINLNHTKTGISRELGELYHVTDILGR